MLPFPPLPPAHRGGSEVCLGESVLWDTGGVPARCGILDVPLGGCAPLLSVWTLHIQGRGKGEEYHPPHVTTLPPPLLGFQKQSQLQIFRPNFHPTYQAMSQRMCPGLGNTVLCPIDTAHPLN